MIWLIGCNGMLGQEVARQLNENKFHWVGTDKEVDITNPDALEDFERKNETSSYEISNLSHSDRQIKWIINCSAYTNVEKAEEDVELAEKINTIGPRNIARLARKIGAKLIHISFRCYQNVRFLYKMSIADFINKKREHASAYPRSN